MPLNKDIKKTLLIGSGPIVIGQAAEFDYSGTQALRVLKEAGIEVVLVNSNPATIMTDNSMADKIYLEPLTQETLKRIIEIEKPDSILSGFGGQTGLTLAMQLAQTGFLEDHGVKLLGCNPETIDKAEDRQLFKETMEKIGQPVVASAIVHHVEKAQAFAKKIGYPVIIRPAFTLGGSGGGIVENDEELREVAANGIALSPINQILVERCIAGWKEIEFEVIRDALGNVIAVCSMENFDPVGVHTGDSIVIAPAVTLADKEYQMLRSAALDIIEELGVEGGCNCQFALNPDSFEYAVIEVNPRVSRSSALASKATGYPIAKVAAKIAIGYSLDEITNAVTGTTYAAFEPALDYVAVKFPKWPFDKFVYAKKELGTQMKATGEVMAIADTFEMALMKAVRGAEIGCTSLRMDKLKDYSIDELVELLKKPSDERLFYVYELIMRDYRIDKIHEETLIDEWFLYKLKLIANCEHELASVNASEKEIDYELYVNAKQLGFLDKTMEKLSGSTIDYHIPATFKMVDTCGGEFEAQTPYFYSTYDTMEMGGINEAKEFVANSKKDRIIVFGAGPIRIGQGIEFDYASVHCVMSLKRLGYEVIVINNNPETVSTDFDTADRLYFEPLNIEDVMNVVELEKPYGVIVAFGGQTAIKLTNELDKRNVRILGTQADSIDRAEDRERFDELLEKMDIKRPKGHTVTNTKDALIAAHDLTYPVLMRPSYVLGGQNMIIAFEDADIIEYMDIILEQNPDNLILIDKYISGLEIEVDAICDGKEVLLPGIMEHIERTGIHSGDSIAVYPAPHINDMMADKVLDITKKLCMELKVKGLVNVQYIVADEELYIIEVNPRASRTIPYLSKVTGVPMCDLATKTSLGYWLSELGYGTGIYPKPHHVCVKVPVFSFEKLADVDIQLGPEMKSTGEVLGIGSNLKEALYKGLVAAGYKLKKSGGVFISVRKSDKIEIAQTAKKFFDMGFELYATEGNAQVLRSTGLIVESVRKIHESDSENDDSNIMNSIELLESGKISYIISTSAKGRDPMRDSVKLRRRAVQLGIPCLTSIDTADAIAKSLMSGFSEMNTTLVDINGFEHNKKQNVREVNERNDDMDKLSHESSDNEQKNIKYIFVTGGVVSGLGKGITAASLGRLLKMRGFKIAAQKLDPYMNVDPGTMSPFQHGEVFVTDDGAETDLDLGHYERFIDEDLNRYSNLTSGKVYWNVLNRERKGGYLGQTVQVIPHITEEIKRFIYVGANTSGADIMITEIGGTIGDIESQPFLEAIRQISLEIGRENCLFIHVTLIPYLSCSEEHKSKPTQHSVKELRTLGIAPDIIIARAERELEQGIIDKIALFCNVKKDCVIENLTLPCLYEAPIMLHNNGLDKVVCRELGLALEKNGEYDNGLANWQSMVDKIHNRKRSTTIAIVGKYVALHDAYLSVREALYHAGYEYETYVDIRWIDSENINSGNVNELLAGINGILVPGGFGDRGIEGKILACRYARENDVPYLGICLGMQIAVIEFARDVCGLSNANSREFNVNGDELVIDLMESQLAVDKKGGTMRLGSYPCKITDNSLLLKAYGKKLINERHRHRFEFNNAYRSVITENGMDICGTSPDDMIVEAVEIRKNSYFVGVQFHPEFKSRPNKPHPLFLGLVKAALEKKL